MSVSVDTVYKTVLLILNKEQRGYMTPDEFNRIGSQVQREIFERYFEDLNQQVRVLQTDMDYSDRVFNVDEKISEFKTDSSISLSNSKFTLPSDLYRLGSATYSGGPNIVEIQKVDRKEYYNIAQSPLTRPSTDFPVYIYEDNKLTVYPGSISDIEVQYVKKPEDIRWGYTVGNLGQYVFQDYPYNPTGLLPNTPFIPGFFTINTVGSAGATRVVTNIDSSQYTYTQSPLSGSTAGTGAIFEAQVTSGSVTALYPISGGTNYNEADAFTFNVTSIFGGSTTGDLSITYLSSSQLQSASTGGYIDFQLHNSERIELITNILLYAGVVIRDPQIVQTAMQQAAQEDRNEKT